MICPHCGNTENHVLDTRVQKEGDIRRRRECSQCRGRFSTIETVLRQYPHIIKKDNRREAFSKEKLRKGIQLACLKRPVSLAQIEGIVNQVTRQVLDKNEKEVDSSFIGKLVMTYLKETDDVAYIRFASVYRTFQDVQEFVQSLKADPLFSDKGLPQ
ncbi:MAG: transcriptional repressor NrdR [Bdellovibrionales bacterium]|nr:transcriptional repressor NrdR [Bdellovibrionales bacterium]